MTSELSFPHNIHNEFRKHIIYSKSSTKLRIEQESVAPAAFHIQIICLNQSSRNIACQRQTKLQNAVTFICNCII